ncbi:hypothetical protein LINPERHAP2_LOCUS20897 [Linum perenne]
MNDYDVSDASSYEGSDCGYDDDDSELECYCGLPAKLRMSGTTKNPFRLFYNCPNYNDCNFFCWFDEPSVTGDKHVDELNRYRHECTRVQQRYVNALQDHENERAKWEIEKEELVSRLSKVGAELDELKRRCKLVGESDLMPPVDPMWSSDKDDSDGDDVKDIHAL